MIESADIDLVDPSTGFELFQETPCPLMSLGCPILDAACSGGLHPGLCELCGEAGSGKSQLCLQLLLQVQLPETLGGRNGKALYICTEKVPSSRLMKFVNGFKRRYPQFTNQNFLENILVRSVDSVQDQRMVLFEWVPALLKNHDDNIKLVVIDSVAAFLRLEGTSYDRSHLSYHLHQLAVHHNICIIASNQVSDVMQNQNRDGQLHFLSSGRLVKPSLGLSWTFGISRSLLLTRDRRSPPRRFMFALGSSYCQDRHTEFVINNVGVFGKSSYPDADT